MSLVAALLTRDPDLLPSRRDEDWRWTGLRELMRTVPPAAPRVDAAAPNPILAGLDAPTLTYANGRALDDGEVAVPATGRGVVVRRFVSATDQTSHHLEISASVGAGAHLVLIDSFEGQAENYFASVSTPIRLDENAHLERIVILDDAADAIAVARAEVTLAPGAQFSQTVLAGGAKRQRFETHLVHPGEGAVVRLDGVYVLGQQRHSDQTTVVAHRGENGANVQLVKGVAAGQARGVFQGRIVVERGADGTDARMGHHALLLSDRAEVDAKPELEIYADDVQCAHGNTVGALDEAAIFYARSRGIPEAEARIMLTFAFLGEVVERIEDDRAREIARAWVETQLKALA